MKKDSIDLLKRSNQSGFTLVEILVVIAILSLSALIVIPRVGGFVNSNKKNFEMLTGLMARTFDDAYIKNHLNYLRIHLNDPSEDESELKFTDNSVEVLNIDKFGKFHNSSNKMLQPIEFKQNKFRFEKVILSSGQEINQGSVMLPYYPKGYSDNIIIHVTVNDEFPFSLIINKYNKNPEIIKEFVTFEDENETF